jgi:hypothetical protein
MGFFLFLFFLEKGFFLKKNKKKRKERKRKRKRKKKKKKKKSPISSQRWRYLSET